MAVGQVILGSPRREMITCDKTMGEGQHLTCIQRKKLHKGDREDLFRRGNSET